MKTIEAAIILFFGMAVHCYGAGDAVSSFTKDENRETTTFRRDGKVILKIILYHSTEPKKRLLLQEVLFNDKVVMDLVEFQGERAFSNRPDSKVSVGIQQDVATGALEGVGLIDDSNGVVETFEAKDSRLVPISGEKLTLSRAMTKDVSELLAPENVKKTSPEAFAKRAVELVTKYKTKESDNQQGERTDHKPSPQDSSPQKKP